MKKPFPVRHLWQHDRTLELPEWLFRGVNRFPPERDLAKTQTNEFGAFQQPSDSVGDNNIVGPDPAYLQAGLGLAGDQLKPPVGVSLVLKLNLARVSTY